MIRHLRIGLTGNIGSGKSTVARLFAELGVPTFDADHIGHALLESDEEVKKKVIKLFGDKILVDQKISRPDVGKIVFEDSKKRTRLEEILHPAILNTINERIMDLPDLPKVHYALVEGALIYETGLEDAFDYIILAVADKKIAIDRAAKNLGMKKADVVKRLNAQGSQAKKEKLADFVIVNNGTMEELRHRVNLIHSIILSLSKQPAEP
jgi:dephospho-CoA kinase